MSKPFLHGGWGRAPWIAALAVAVALAVGCGDSGAGAGDGGSPGGGDGGDAGAAVVVVLTPGTPADAATHFGHPPVSDPARAPTVRYPLDRVLFPRNVAAPDVQWEGAGAAGDIYRVGLAGAAPAVTAYVVHTGAAFRYDWVADAALWGRVADAAAGHTLTLTVDRWDAARDEVVAGVPVRLRFARGAIAGAVYYWTLGSFAGTEGRIVRVLQGADTPPRPENIMPTPPPRPDGARCAACHGLSRDGNRLALSLGDGQLGGVYDATADLTGSDPPAIFTFRQPWYFAAFNPAGTRLVMTDPSQHAFLLDGTSGRVLDDTLPAATHPAWSPDGARVAMITSADNAWNLTRGDLAVMDALPGDHFSAARVLHRGADLASAPEGGAMDAYPSFAPDGRFLAFQHGTRVLLSASGAAGALYAVLAGGGDPVRLSNASGGTPGSDGWYPNFIPFVTPGDDVGQVYWLLFYARRDYGNRVAGTEGTHRRQIWVSAVSTQIGAGSDPSAVPYWLPGQDVTQENASAFWAPRPCRPTNQSCSQDAQCCGGNCNELTDGRHVCAPPGAGACRLQGQSCGATSDCCDPARLSCAGGVCLPTPG